MRLVLTNDDGVESPGIHALAATCAELGHDVLVLAPASDLSGASAAVGRIEPDQRLELRRVELPGAAAGIEAYALDGPPGLAALVACQGGAGDVPDLVLSGINGGPNTGHSILHSGTVGAALTAASFGVSALAVSLDVADPMPWRTACAFVEEGIELVASAPVATVLNLNAPAMPLADVRGLRWATLDRFGTFRVAVAEREETSLQMEFRATGAELDPESDTALLAAGFVTVTAIEGIAFVPPERLHEQRARPEPEAALVARPEDPA
jgi:5'-nucleotidase